MPALKKISKLTSFQSDLLNNTLHWKPHLEKKRNIFRYGYLLGLHYLKLFVPSGVPAVLLPLLVVIEVISYFTRPISLSVRLFANMMAGHTMLKVFAGFVVAMGFLGGWAPLAMMVALTGLEILVAFLQAYVFAVLTCIYLNDAINMH